ncbi:UPF0389 protein CG9231-like isoform X2 [Tachypleus tridentatus]
MAHIINRLGLSLSGLSRIVNRGYQRPLTFVRMSTSKAETPVSSEHELTYHRPNSFEKRLLVWFRKYPSYGEVPDFVPQNVMERVRNKARIRMNIYFCILAAIGCFAMVVSGKKAHNRGESMRKINEEFHEKHAHKN